MVYKSKIYKYRKPHRYKRKKPIFRNRFFWLGILVLVVAGAVFYFLFFSAVFQVEKIIVTGEEKVAKEDLKLLAEERLESRILFFRTKSIFAVDLKRMRKDILDIFPQIAELEMGRGFPDTVNILVVERLGLAVYCQDGSCFLLDNEGVIFEASLPETDLMKVISYKKIDNLALGEEVIEKELLSQIFDIKHKLAESLKISIAEADIVSEERLNMKTAESWQIYFNLKGDLAWQITELSLVLEKQIPPEEREDLEYIDLRFNRVFYK